MKITWFGHETFRIYLGGRIFLTSSEKIPESIDMREVRSGVDQEIDFDEGLKALEPFDPEAWQPKRPVRMIDQDPNQIFRILRLFSNSLFIDESDEGPVILAPAGGDKFANFADNAVVILFGAGRDMPTSIRQLCAAARPRLVALAAQSLSDAEFTEIGAATNGTPVQVLEPFLALEA